MISEAELLSLLDESSREESEERFLGVVVVVEHGLEPKLQGRDGREGCQNETRRDATRRDELTFGLHEWLK